MNFFKNGLFNILIYGCGLVVVNGLSFLMLPFYTRVFSPAEYAIITIIFTILPFTRYCLPLEICQAAPVFCSDDKTKSQQYVSIGFWFTLTINLLCYSLIYFFNTLFHFISLSNSSGLLCVALVLVMDCLFYYSSNILRWQIKPFLYNFIISGAAILEVAFTLLFVLFFKLSINGVFYSWILSRCLGFLTVLFFTREFYSFTFDFNILKKMLSFSAPLVLSNIAYNINRAFDRWIIAFVIGLSAVGVFGAGATIGGIVNFIMGSISAALTPFIYKNHERKEAPAEIVKLFYGVITLCVFVAMFFVLFNNEILSILLAKEYYLKLMNQPLVPIVVLTAILAGLNVFTPGIAIKKKTHYVIWFNAFSLLINTVVSFSLIKKLGVNGVAIATCLSVLFNSLMYMLISQKYYRLPFQKRYVIPLAILFISFYVGGMMLGTFYTPFELEGLIIKSLYYLVGMVLLASLVFRASKVVNKNEPDMLVAL